MNDREVMYLIQRANQYGLDGKIVIQIKTPQNATQDISDAEFYVMDYKMLNYEATAC